MRELWGVECWNKRARQCVMCMKLWISRDTETGMRLTDRSTGSWFQRQLSTSTVWGQSCSRVNYGVSCWCATARRPSCQDSADWCRQLYAGQCYDKTVEQVCCATCSRHLTSQPGESLSSLHSVRLSVSSTHICNHFCAKDRRSLYIVLTHFAASLYVQTRIHLLPPFWWRWLLFSPAFVGQSIS